MSAGRWSPRRKKTAKERREQKERAIARHLGFLLKCSAALGNHRGAEPTKSIIELCNRLSQLTEGHRKSSRSADRNVMPPAAASSSAASCPAPPSTHVIEPLLFSCVPDPEMNAWESLEEKMPTQPAKESWEALPSTFLMKRLHEVLIMTVPNGTSLAKVPKVYADALGTDAEIPGDNLLDFLEGIRITSRSLSCRREFMSSRFLSARWHVLRLF